MTSVIPPMAWCGVEHPHNTHRWAKPSGMTAWWSDCPGSTCDHSTAESALAGLQGVEALIEQARKVSPSPSMTLYVGDVEKALGLRAESVRGIRGASDDGPVM